MPNETKEPSQLAALPPPLRARFEKILADLLEVLEKSIEAKQEPVVSKDNAARDQMATPDNKSEEITMDEFRRYPLSQWMAAARYDIHPSQLTEAFLTDVLAAEQKKVADAFARAGVQMMPKSESDALLAQGHELIRQRQLKKATARS
ncbi:MAG: hypothetical protein WDO56_00060 [Gammaproteobacteria bacterium]